MPASILFQLRDAFLLGQVRETGMAGVSEFEKKVQAMATVIEEQADELVG